MKNYYVEINGQQSEPMTLNQLKKVNLTKNSLVWHEGLAQWTKAGDLEELNGLFRSIPPPIRNTVPPSLQKIQFVEPAEKKSFLSSPLKMFVVGGFSLAVLVLLFVSFTDTSQSDTETLAKQNTETRQQQQELIEQQNAKIAEQERLEKERQERERKATIEKRLNEISTQLALDYKQLEKAKEQLNIASRFVILRSVRKRNEQINKADEEVKYWENEINNLEKESDGLKAGYN